MRKNLFPVATGLLLVVAIPTLVGCDKLKTVVTKLAKPGSSKKDAASKGIYSADQVADVTKSDHADFIARKNALVIVDFHASWCPPCKQLGPVLIKATEAHPGVVYLGKVDVDQSRELAGENQVSSIPDVRIYKNGKEVDRFVGFPGEKEVLEKIAKLSEGIVPPPAPAARAPGEPVVKPFEKDWMPPGMSRQKSAVPGKT